MGVAMADNEQDLWVQATFGVHPAQYQPVDAQAGASQNGATQDGTPNDAASSAPAPPAVSSAPAPPAASSASAPPARPAFSPPPQSRQPTLRPGDQSPDGWVEYMQELLKIPVTGTYDRATEKAVRAFQAANGCQVDGVVGNQTWSVLRHEKKESVGTDGRNKHSFEEKGAEARFFTEDKWVIYQKSDDSVAFTIVSVGDSDDIASHKATFRITPPGGQGQVVELPIGPATEKSPDGQGNRHSITITGLKANYPPEPGAPGLYHIEAYLDAELGGDRWSGDVRDKAPVAPPQQVPAKPKEHIPPEHPLQQEEPTRPTKPTTPPPQVDTLIGLIKGLIGIATQIVKEWIGLQTSLAKCTATLMWACKGEAFNAGKAMVSVIGDVKNIITLLTEDVAGVETAGVTDIATIPLTIKAVYETITDIQEAISTTQTMISCMQNSVGDDEDAKAAVAAMSAHLNNITNLVGSLRSQVGRIAALIGV